MSVPMTIEVDLEPVKFCLMKKKGWSLEKVDKVEKLYLQFLQLIAMYPENSIVPTEAIDDMWHMHILDTQKYAEDCNRLFGRLVHHFPYYGIRGSEDEVSMQTAFENTVSLFSEHFDSLPFITGGHGTNKPSSCDDFCTSCDTGNCESGSQGSALTPRQRPDRAMVLELADNADR